MRRGVLVTALAAMTSLVGAGVFGVPATFAAGLGFYGNGSTCSVSAGAQDGGGASAVVSVGSNCGGDSGTNFAGGPGSGTQATPNIPGNDASTVASNPCLYVRVPAGVFDSGLGRYSGNSDVVPASGDPSFCGPTGPGVVFGQSSTGRGACNGSGPCDLMLTPGSPTPMTPTSRAGKTGPVVAAVNPAQVALSALAKALAVAPAPNLQLWPPPNHLYVNQPTWMQDRNWAPTTATASEAGVAATVTLRPVQLMISSTDSTNAGLSYESISTDCATAGEAPASQKVFNATPPPPGACTLSWRWPSANYDGASYTLSYDLAYSVSWTSSTGAGGNLPVVVGPTTTEPVKVGEIEPVMVPSGQGANQ
jgi:hypothetical protein